MGYRTSERRAIFIGCGIGKFEFEFDSNEGMISITGPHGAEMRTGGEGGLPGSTKRGSGSIAAAYCGAA